MGRKLLLMTLVIGFAMLFVTVAIHAGTEFKDVISMNNKAYTEHEKGIVEFSHKKHAEDYAKKSPDLYKHGCGECHHDDKGKPLNDLKDGDPVQSCFDCHNKPGELKGKKAKGLSDAEKLAYHANALHKNCIGCHKKYNRENKTKAAPQKCTDCHPKKKK